MTVGLVAISVYSYLSNTTSIHRTYLEAGDSGRLVRTDRPTLPSGPRVALRKPEPGLLLNHKVKLRLSRSQIVHIGEIAASWSTSKFGLEQEMGAGTKFLSERGVSLASVASTQANLAAYSELSREYGIRRASAWSGAVAVLDEQQRRDLARLLGEQEGQE